MQHFWITLLVLSYLMGSSQSLSVSRYELFWAVGHPIAAVKVNKITKRCDDLNDTVTVFSKLDRHLNGGKADAFRHVFYMAAYSQKINSKRLKKLGEAHEKKNYHDFLKTKTEFGEQADSLSCVMDLFNNNVGIELGRPNKSLSLEELRKLVFAKIMSGETLIMKRNKMGSYLTCKDEVISLAEYKNKWNVPKCLVTSNYNFED